MNDFIETLTFLWFTIETITIILDNLFVKDVSGQFIKVSLYATPQAVVELAQDVKETFFKEESQTN